MTESEAIRLLHILWTKAVGTPNYDKAEWLQLEALIREKFKMRG